MLDWRRHASERAVISVQWTIEIASRLCARRVGDGCVGREV